MTDTISNTCESTSDTVTLTVELPREMVERLNALSPRATGGRDGLISRMIEDRIEYVEWSFAKVQEAIDDLDAGGRTYSDDEVAAWIETLGTPDERPLPE
jgi:predicted transcriptional regulator